MRGSHRLFRNERASVMSAVIEFPLDRIRRAGEIGAAGPAEVVIFPGVRVERLKYDLAERLPAARTGSGQQPHPGEFEFY